MRFQIAIFNTLICNSNMLIKVIGAGEGAGAERGVAAAIYGCSSSQRGCGVR